MTGRVMTGREHYLEAVRLLSRAKIRGEHVAEAQVHATLAAAAASEELSNQLAAKVTTGRVQGWWRRRREMRRIKRDWERKWQARWRALSEGGERTGYGSDVR